MLRDKQIVIIDDTESIRNFLRISLEAHNAVVQTAATASGGLALCEKTPPDLVVLDIGLPDHEGLDILQRIKRLGKGSPPAVIILTVRKERTFIEKAKRLGADAYLIKPCFVEDVIEVISQILDIDKPSHIPLMVSENVPSLPGEEDILLIKGSS